MYTNSLLMYSPIGRDGERFFLNERNISLKRVSIRKKRWINEMDCSEKCKYFRFLKTSENKQKHAILNSSNECQKIS